MELIDKAKLYDEISRLEKMAMDNANEKEQHLQAYLININSLNERTMMKYLVADFPTIEPPKGEWIRNENPLEISCECSVCHAKDYWHDIDKYNEYYWFHRNFCPNCGADMRGKK